MEARTPSNSQTSRGRGMFGFEFGQDHSNFSSLPSRRSCFALHRWLSSFCLLSYSPTAAGTTRTTIVSRRLKAQIEKLLAQIFGELDSLPWAGSIAGW
jgi:hypothetical protein